MQMITACMHKIIIRKRDTWTICALISLRTDVLI